MFSIVIPLLNEADNLALLLPKLKPLVSVGHEVILVDGGSSDASVEIAHSLEYTVLTSAAGRAVQMNCGAGAARGEYLMFLHADTRLPDDVLNQLDALFASESLWEFFPVHLDDKAKVFRLIEWCMNKRSQLSSIASGDQTLCVDREQFQRMGGFPDIDLMEDVALSSSLKKFGSPWLASSAVTCSARKWLKHGIYNTVLMMWLLRLAYYLGVSPTRLKKIYYR